MRTAKFTHVPQGWEPGEWWRHVSWCRLCSSVFAPPAEDATPNERQVHLALQQRLKDDDKVRTAEFHLKGEV